MLICVVFHGCAPLYVFEGVVEDACNRSSRASSSLHVNLCAFSWLVIFSFMCVYPQYSPSYPTYIPPLSFCLA